MGCEKVHYIFDVLQNSPAKVHFPEINLGGAVPSLLFRYILQKAVFEGGLRALLL
jgi:hypothetical protein